MTEDIPQVEILFSDDFSSRLRYAVSAVGNDATVTQNGVRMNSLIAGAEIGLLEWCFER